MIDMTSRFQNSIKIAEEFVGYTSFNSDGELFRVIDYEYLYSEKDKRHHMLYLVQFAVTGYENLYRKQSILKGGCRDPYYPTIYGVACVGEISTVDNSGNGTNIKEYAIWHSMIQRCYDVYCKSYITYGGAGVTVCDRWNCFEYFFRDLPTLPNYQLWKDNPGKYHLDKDYLQRDLPAYMKVYSPATCVFILSQLNAKESNDRQHKGRILPTGIQLSHGNNYAAFYDRYRLGTFSTLEAAISQRNDYIRNHANIPNELINPIEHEIDHIERRKYRTQCAISGNKTRMCIEIGDDHSEEFIAKIAKEMQKNGKEV